MSKRRRKSGDDPAETLFDLPLHGSGDEPEPAAETLVESADDLPLRGQGEGPVTESDLEAGEEPDPLDDTDEEEVRAAGEEVPAGVADRLVGGLVDLAVQGGAVALAAFLSRMLGIPVGMDDYPPFLVFGLVFSFLYAFIPLAFWGHTPGMAWVGHTARNLDGEPLTFSQTVLRWLGSLLTLGLAGLPLLLALSGRSLTDRLSDSRTEKSRL